MSTAPKLLKPRTHRMPFLEVSPRAKAEKAARQRARGNPVVSALYRTTYWRDLRLATLRDAGFRCCVPGCLARACVADHRIPHRGDNKLFFSRDNLQAMCKPHHDEKTARHDGGFGNQRRALPRRPSMAPAGGGVTVGGAMKIPRPARA